MCPEERKLRFRVVKTADIRPGPRIVTRFAAQWRPIRPLLRHAILELAMMNILMTTCTSHVFENEGQDLVRAAGGAHFVAIVTGDCGVRSRQRVACLLMHGHGESRLVEILYGMAILASVSVGRGSKLIVMWVFMAIQAGREFDLVDGVLARWEVALVALHLDVLALQRVGRSVVFLHAKQ